MAVGLDICSCATRMHACRVERECVDTRMDGTLLGACVDACARAYAHACSHARTCVHASLRGDVNSEGACSSAATCECATLFEGVAKTACGAHLLERAFAGEVCGRHVQAVVPLPLCEPALQPVALRVGAPPPPAAPLGR
eukprot:2396562-Pleurochrysis_carterae.AAC.1